MTTLVRHKSLAVVGVALLGIAAGCTATPTPPPAPVAPAATSSSASTSPDPGSGAGGFELSEWKPTPSADSVSPDDVRRDKAKLLTDLQGALDKAAPGLTWGRAPSVRLLRAKPSEVCVVEVVNVANKPLPPKLAAVEVVRATKATFGTHGFQRQQYNDVDGPLLVRAFTPEALAEVRGGEQVSVRVQVPAGADQCR